MYGTERRIFVLRDFFIIDFLPYSEYMLHSKAYERDAQPAAEPCKDRLPAGFYQFYDIGVQTDGGHCHDDQELAQLFERIRYGRRKLEYGSYNGSKYKEQNKERKGFLQAES